MLGLTPEQVRDKVRALWQHDVLAEWLPEPEQAGNESTNNLDEHAAASVEASIVSNQFSALQAMLDMSSEVAVQVTTVGDAPAGIDAETVAVSHAHEEKADIHKMLSWVRRHVGARAVIVVLNRHQAFQISYLYELDDDRCLVEPVYPGELRKVILGARGG